MKPGEGNMALNAEESRLFPKSMSEDDELKSRNNGTEREKHTGKNKKLFSLFNSNTLTDGVITNDEVLGEEEKSKENCVNDSTVSCGEILENNNDKVKHALVNSVEPPLTSSTVNAQNDDKDEFSTVKNMIEESCENSVVEPSPDFFSGSPAGSQSSCGSFSLLQDCDPLTIQNPELPGIYPLLGHSSPAYFTSFSCVCSVKKEWFSLVEDIYSYEDNCIFRRLTLE